MPRGERHAGGGTWRRQAHGRRPKSTGRDLPRLAAACSSSTGTCARLALRPIMARQEHDGVGSEDGEQRLIERKQHPGGHRDDREGDDDARQRADHIAARPSSRGKGPWSRTASQATGKAAAMVRRPPASASNSVWRAREGSRSSPAPGAAGGEPPADGEERHPESEENGERRQDQAGESQPSKADGRGPPRRAATDPGIAPRHERCSPGQAGQGNRRREPPPAWCRPDHRRSTGTDRQWRW